MSLPYPREAETGELLPRLAEPRIPFDVGSRLQGAITAHGTDVEIFGVPFGARDTASAEALVERYRSAVQAHFNERVSAPNATIWQLFADQVHDQLQQHAQLDDEILDVMNLTIDNF